MQKKTILKIIIAFIFTIVLIIGGVIFFQRLSSDKKIYSIDLQKHIPKNSNKVIEIRRENELKNVVMDKKIETLLHSISGELSYPFYLMGVSTEDQAVIAKLSSSQEIKVRDIISKSLYPTFPPQKRRYKNTDILFYTTKARDEFFICAYFNGIFLAGYNYKSLQAIIDVEATKSFFTASFYQDVSPFFKSASLVYYQNIDSLLAVYSLNQRDSVLVLDGYLNRKVDLGSEDSLMIDQSIFPTNYEAFQVETKTHIFDKSLSTTFKAPYYTFWMDSVMTLSATKFDVDRYQLYDILNSIERKLVGKNLYRHGYTMGKKYSIYSGSDLFTKEVFKTDQIVYFAFKEGYLLYSKDKNILYKYILKAENSGLNLDLKDMDEMFFYTKDLSIVNHPFIDKLNLRGTDLTLEVYPDNDYYKIEVRVKHF